MSEDVSATMRVGITVIIVAALVATVLNLMVMSQSILSNGQSTLQSGIDSVSAQEFAPYDNTKISGTQVQTALSLFQGRDCALLIQTKSLRNTTGYTASDALNYGSLLCAGASPTGALVTKKTKSTSDPVATPVTGDIYVAKIGSTASGTDCYQLAGDPQYTAVLHATNGLTDSNYNIVGTTTVGNPQYLLSSARFSSTLVKDTTGNTIGIIFIQME